MRHKKLSNPHPGESVERISLIKYSKTACGVDFLLNTARSSEKRGWFDTAKRYKTDFFEFFFFQKASGHLFLSGKRIELHDQMILIISPYQQQEWHVTIDTLDYTFLIFQEEFINNFLSDKYFMYRLLYCYQNELPTYFDMTAEEMAPFLELSSKIRHELLEPIADSYHMIVAYLYQFLLRLNRFYAHLFELPFSLPQNTYAYQYKLLLEKNIRHKNRVSDYAEMIGISRVSLNKAVEREFGVTATHLLKRRLLQEVKNDLLFTDLPVKEIAYQLNFSEPNHLARFFKQQTGETISEFIASIKQQI